MPEEEGAARILAHWARYKVLQQQVPDDTIAEAIVNKIKDTGGISYADIAEEVGWLVFQSVGWLVSQLVGQSLTAWMTAHLV